MEQLFPGFFCWQAQYRPGRDAYSAWVEGESENVLIDPFTPDEGLSRFSHPSKAIIVLLTTGNHERDAYSCKLALRAEIWAPEAALSDMDMVPDRVFGSDDELPCGIQAYHLEGSHSEGETALLVPRGPGVLVIGDGLVARPDAEWRVFQPHERDALQSLRDEDFDAIVTSHGAPVLSGAKADLHAYLEA
jgi:glyoxylase-like metal-dependent hydrolase (beta-lactamase superfamily II)